MTSFLISRPKFVTALLLTLTTSLALALPALAQGPVTVDDIPGSPIALPEDGSGDGTACGTVITRTLTVTQTGAISKVKLGLNVTHGYRSEVRASLTSPGNTTVNLTLGAMAVMMET